MRMTEQEMVAALRRRGIVATPPTRRQPAPQRKTLAESSSYSSYEEDYSEPILSGGNQPQNWKSLADRRVPWPRNLDTEQVLHELAPFMLYRMFQQEAAGRGAPISSLLNPNEEL